MPDNLPTLSETAALQTSGAVDPSARAGTTYVHEVGKWGMEVAEAIAAQEPLNYNCAEMSMRNLAGLANVMRPEDYTALPEEDKKLLTDTASATIFFLHGSQATEETKNYLAEMRPGTADETALTLFRWAFNALQVRVSLGPTPEAASEEAPIRTFVRQYARTFARTLFGLSTTGNALTRNPDQMAYVTSTIRAATPAS